MNRVNRRELLVVVFALAEEVVDVGAAALGDRGVDLGDGVGDFTAANRDAASLAVSLGVVAGLSAFSASS